MSDTMRDAFEAWWEEEGQFCRAGGGDYEKTFAFHAWQAAQSQPAPPVPQTVQEIMRLMGPYVHACTEYERIRTSPRRFGLATASKALDEAFKPLLAALTTLVEKNHELQFSLDGVNAMRRPEWQPIETAPKDGPLILLGLPADDECDGVALPGWWQEAYDDAPDEMGSDAGFVDCFFQYFRPSRSFGTEAYRDAGIQPTHWQPMPPPPTPSIGCESRGCTWHGHITNGELKP